jgi:hypothetical protein
MFELSLGMRLLVFVVLMAVGFGCILKTIIVRDLIGEFPWAEQHMGGTYNMVKLVGVLLIMLAVVFLFNG